MSNRGTRNKIEDLRNNLFEVMERVMDPKDTMEVDRALAVAAIGKIIIDSAKLEISYMRAAGRVDSPTGFVPALGQSPRGVLEHGE